MYIQLHHINTFHYFTLKSQAKPFETIDQLEQSSFIIGAQMGTAYQNMFRVGIIDNYKL